jgi:hypothetical protein
MVQRFVWDRWALRPLRRLQDLARSRGFSDLHLLPVLDTVWRFIRRARRLVYRWAVEESALGQLLEQFLEQFLELL